MRRVLVAWLALDCAAVVLLARRGRPEANAHPSVRNGSDDWY